MIEVSTQELSLQDADLLPARDTLATWGSDTVINAFNFAVAVSHGDGDAVARAIQTIVVLED